MGQAPVALAIEEMEEMTEAMLAVGMTIELFKAMGMVQAGTELLMMGAIEAVERTEATESITEVATEQAGTEATVVGIEQTGTELLLLKTAELVAIMEQAGAEVEVEEAEVIIGQAELTVLVTTGHLEALET